MQPNGGLPSPQEGLRKFAYTLEALRPTPLDCNKYKGPYREQGKPLLDKDVLDLIQADTEISSPSQGPQWAHDLRAWAYIQKGLQSAERMSLP